MSFVHCPHCGCNLAKLEPFAFGNVEIGREGDVLYRGQAVRLTRTLHGIVEALIQARGRYLTQGVLADILGTDINDATIKKYIQRARAAFQEVDPDFDQIEAMRGFGAYKWRKSGQAGYC